MRKTAKKDSSQHDQSLSIVGIYENKNSKTLHKVFFEKNQLSMEHLTGINKGKIIPIELDFNNYNQFVKQ